MTHALFSLLAQAAEEEPLPSTIIQSVFVGMLILFLVSIFSTRFIARAVNIHDATFGQAFVATLFRNMASAGAMFFLGMAPDVPQVLTLIISLALLPVLVYKVVFSAENLQAVLIWLGVIVIEGLVGVGLSTAGIFDLKGILNL